MFVLYESCEAFFTDISTFSSPIINLPNFQLFGGEILKRNFQKVRILKHILPGIGY